MKSWKKVLSCTLATLMTFGMTACGGRADLDEDDGGAGGGNSSTVGSHEGVESDYAEGITISTNGKEVYKDTKEGKTRIKISYVEAGFGSDWLRVIATHFVKENPDYWLFLDGDPGLTELVSPQLSSQKNLPDLYMVLAHNWQDYALNGWIEELSDVYAAKPDGEDGKTVYEKMGSTWQEYCQTANAEQVIGKYAYPWSEGVSGIAYNGKLFEEKGWEVPTTWDELIALCQTIKTDTNGKVAPFVYPGLIGGYFDFLGMTHWIQSAGVDGMEEFFSYGSAEVFNPETQPGKGKLEALEAFTQVFGPGTNNSLKGSMSKNHTEAQMSFLKGEAAMIINGSWLETEMLLDLPKDFEMRMMRIPYLSTAKKDADGNFLPINYGMTPDFMIVPSQAPQKEAAKDFLVFMAKDEMLRYFTKYSSTLRPFSYDVSDLKPELSKFTNDCINIWETSTSYFAVEKGILANNSEVTAWITGSPYTLLVYGLDNDGTTPSRYCKLQYQEAKGNWQRWVSDSTK